MWPREWDSNSGKVRRSAIVPAIWINLGPPALKFTALFVCWASIDPLWRRQFLQAAVKNASSDFTAIDHELSAIGDRLPSERRPLCDLSGDAFPFVAAVATRSHASSGLCT